MTPAAAAWHTSLVPGQVVLGKTSDSAIIKDVIIRKVCATVTVFFVNLWQTGTLESRWSRDASRQIVCRGSQTKMGPSRRRTCKAQSWREGVGKIHWLWASKRNNVHDLTNHQAQRIEKWCKKPTQFENIQETRSQRGDGRLGKKEKNKKIFFSFWYPIQLFYPLGWGSDWVYHKLGNAPILRSGTGSEAWVLSG